MNEIERRVGTSALATFRPSKIRVKIARDRSLLSSSRYDGISRGKSLVRGEISSERKIESRRSCARFDSNNLPLAPISPVSSSSHRASCSRQPPVLSRGDLDQPAIPVPGTRSGTGLNERERGETKASKHEGLPVVKQVRSVRFERT